MANTIIKIPKNQRCKYCNEYGDCILGLKKIVDDNLETQKVICFKNCPKDSGAREHGECYFILKEQL